MVVSKFLSSFEKVEDPYLRERGQDLNHIYQRLLTTLVKGKASGVNAKGIRGKVIIVAPDLSPADTIQIDLHKVSGFVTDVGGRTSHTSIVARALEIPAVVGLGIRDGHRKEQRHHDHRRGRRGSDHQPHGRGAKGIPGKAGPSQRPEKGIPAHREAEGGDEGRVQDKGGRQYRAARGNGYRGAVRGRRHRPLQDGVHLSLPQDPAHRDGPLPHLPEARRKQGGEIYDDPHPRSGRG